MPTSVRLDAKTESILRRLSQRTGRPKSAIIREAIERLGRELDEAEQAPSLYARVADLIGIAAGGPPDLAERSEEVLRALFAQRKPPS